MEIINRIQSINWSQVQQSMNANGYAAVPKLLTAQECESFITDYNNQDLYRKTISMERYRFGLGEYKYFRYPLPGMIQSIRENIYPNLSTIASDWMLKLGINKQFPKALDELHQHCRDHNQVYPTVLILKYGEGGHNTLHQDLYGEVFFQFKWSCF